MSELPFQKQAELWGQAYEILVKRGVLACLVEWKLLDPTQCAAVGLRADQVARIWKQFIDRPGAIYWNRPWALFSLVNWASLNGVTC